MYISESYTLKVCMPTADHACSYFLIFSWYTPAIYSMLSSQESLFLIYWCLLQIGGSGALMKIGDSGHSLEGRQLQQSIHCSGGYTREANLFWQFNTERCKCFIFEKANKYICRSFSEQVCWFSKLYFVKCLILQLDAKWIGKQEEEV